MKTKTTVESKSETGFTFAHESGSLSLRVILISEPSRSSDAQLPASLAWAIAAGDASAHRADGQPLCREPERGSSTMKYFVTAAQSGARLGAKPADIGIPWVGRTILARMWLDCGRAG